MSALNNQTNRNVSRYFFATSEDGEQTLGLQYGTTGGVPNLSTMSVTISGSGGNGVVVNYAPAYGASEYMIADGALLAGTAGYFSPSTLASTITGVSLSQDRLSGSGIGAIENFGGNGSFNGFEFLSHGVDGALISTTSQSMNQYISSIGRAGASGVLGSSGTFVCAQTQASAYTSLDYPSGGGGRTSFVIQDLSGANGVTAQQRWGIGTSGVATGGDVGSDFTIYAYGDAGNFLNADLFIRRRDGGVAIPNVSSLYTTISTGVSAQMYPTNKTNSEFGAEGLTEVIAGASNQATPFVVLFSTPMTGLNPNGQTFVSINFANALSSGSNHVNYKMGFSTGTGFTNIIQTAYVPGGQFSPSGLPTAATPTGHTLITACLDDDGVNPDGTGNLYILGQLSDPNAAADQIFCAKGLVSEATRNALVWRPF